MMRLLLISACVLYRDGVRSLLETCDGIAVVAVAANVDDAFARLRDQRPPDVILFEMAAAENISAVQSLIARFAPVPLVALNVPATEDVVVECANVGARGLCTAETPLDDVVAAIDFVARGEAWCSPSIATVLLRRVQTLAAATDARTALTVREQDVLALINDGFANKEIAQKLTIAVPTVRNHVHNILSKLGVHSRREAAAVTRSFNGSIQNRVTSATAGGTARAIATGHEHRSQDAPGLRS